ncbi:hypothetical protein [Marinomonas algicola]|uniref:hypothetical protein n=1 Tax=Marinomonas algicola TaxID=2773454 RepID=UPI00174AEB1C|nr:hypothetical protein [Marinomonas algicola]
MKFDIFCCSVVDVPVIGDWIVIQNAKYNVECTFIDMDGGKRSVELAAGDTLNLSFVGLQLRSSGENQTIEFRTGWGMLTPASNTGAVVDEGGEEEPPSSGGSICVDIASPVVNAELNMAYFHSEDYEVPANSNIDVHPFSISTPMNAMKVSRFMVQNVSDTLTKCRISDMNDSGGFWCVGHIGDIADSGWVVGGRMNYLVLRNLSDAPAKITITTLYYEDVGNACRVTQVPF